MIDTFAYICKKNECMKKMFLLLLLTFSIQFLAAQCKIAELVKNNKAQIVSPYIFDGFSVTNLNFSQTNKLVKSEFIALKGQHYQLILATSGFEEEVSLQIIYKKTVESSEELLMKEMTIGGSITQQLYEINKPGFYYFKYSIPKSSQEIDHKECVLLINSYKKK